MDDYVTLSLETYNSLYDKAQSYIKLTAVEESNDYYDVEMVSEDYDIPVGAKGKDLEPQSDIPYIDWDKHYKGTFTQAVKGKEYDNVYCTKRRDIKEIKKGNN